ncbi:matrixin family metalloprotease [Plastoroseomonas hellenica]|uniref:matrixin family metalloprotease n=1 Tax=Plastoroseomonas hellenica TaxID=2687306 RepID=UPI0034623659
MQPDDSVTGGEKAVPPGSKCAGTRAPGRARQWLSTSTNAGWLLAVAALALPYRADAYTLSEVDWRHQSNPIERPFVICATGPGVPPNAPAVIRQAAALWSAGRFQFRFAAERCLIDPSLVRPDGVNYIDFGVLPPDRGGDTENAAAWGRQEALGSNRAGECDIRFNINRRWYAGTGSPAADQHDLFSIALHEFGHCLGLDHTHAPVADAVMLPTLPAGQVRRRLLPDDVAGRRAIYGPR